MSDFTVNGKITAIQWTGSNLSAIQTALSPVGWLVFSSTQETGLVLFGASGPGPNGVYVPLNGWIPSGIATTGNPSYGSDGVSTPIDNATFVAGHTLAP